ncbi:Hypothetical_protein [Hexamita inflata]|uniref:Hypothetical_protein n=1 Tax=Hexamita inflata TaxID=28002 RepID=A0AA86U9M3_9EUKA|nr:Hypothetical protein HINF_LOCUS34274 [Hexamita inflata]
MQSQNILITIIGQLFLEHQIGQEFPDRGQDSGTAVQHKSQGNKMNHLTVTLSTILRLNNSIFISQIMTIHKSKLSYATINQSQYHIFYLPFRQMLLQNHFSSAVSHLLSVQTGLNVVVSELELCQRLNEHLKSCPKQQFWNQLSELMQIKTARQLSDYYTNSYSKNLHTGQLTTEDKTVLRELNQQMRQMKPAEVAKVFLVKQKTQTYFKRNIVMYVINLRK